MNGKPKEHPIIFSSEMIRAILDNKKTQTRRPIKPQPETHICALGGNLVPMEDGTWSWECQECGYSGEWHCPYGRPGDLLWVRETWALDATFGLLTDTSKRLR